MATTFKTFLNNDIVQTRTLLHEAIPLTGTIISGTYASEGNVRNYSHGMFQSVYDYPFLSSSANHIFDVTVGISTASIHSASDPTSLNHMQEKKLNIYNQFAQVLMGHDVNGKIQRFDQDGDITGGGTKLDNCVFMTFSRLLSKDEIKKGSFILTVATGSGSHSGDMTKALTCSDYGAANAFKVNSPAGEYAILYTSSVAATADSGIGLLFYQAGIAVLSSSIFNNTYHNVHADASTGWTMLGAGGATGGQVGQSEGQWGARNVHRPAATGSIDMVLSGTSISGACDGFRNRIINCTFNNTTELNSTVYFCRINHNDFNYSSNPTYLSSSKIVVKNNSTDMPVTYITTVGLYSPDNEMLAVAKLSEPLKKDPNTELTLRVRLDY